MPYARAACKSVAYRDSRLARCPGTCGAQQGLRTPGTGPKTHTPCINCPPPHPGAPMTRLALFALLLSIPILGNSAPVPPLADSFQAFWSAAQGKPFEEQEALWDK